MRRRRDPCVSKSIFIIGLAPMLIQETELCSSRTSLTRVNKEIKGAHTTGEAQPMLQGY